MPKKFVTHQDKVIFKKSLLPGAKIIGPNETIIKAATPKWIIQGKAVCLQGDEKSVKLKTKYKSNFFGDIPGEGEFKVVPLGPGLGHLSPKHTVNGKPKIFQQGAKKFDVQFIVSKPSKKILPGPPPVQVPDPIPMYFGKAHFVVKTNTKETEA